jgi:Zn-dependent M28 family amino/carboxypeptidase
MGVRPDIQMQSYRSLAVLTTLVAVTTAAALAEPPRSAPPFVSEIEAARLRAHVEFLADDLLEGRAPGTRGGDLAARYIATQFALAGLEPAGENGTYFQPVEIVETEVDPSFRLRARGKEPGAEVQLAYPTEVVAYTDLEAERAEAAGELVFVGHGIVAPEFRWNDYEGVDAKGRIALIMVNEPAATDEEPELFEGRALTYYGRWTYKYEEAARQGAAGAILIHTDESATYPWQVVEGSWTGPQYSIPATPGAPALALKAWVTDESARRLAALGGHDLDALRRAAHSRGARPVRLGVEVSGTIQQQVARRTSPNVIGMIPGQNTEEAIVYTSHYDHLGTRQGPKGETIVFNGARDNASGIAGIIEIARAMKMSPTPPGRHVMFVATTAEESGLLGSEYFASNPPIPIERVAANINVDSLNVFGPTRDLVLLGQERSTLGELVERVASDWQRRVGLDQHPERGYFFRSDHFPLAKAGVPALSLSTGTEFVGPRAERARELAREYQEKHYHQPSDVVYPDWDFEAAAGQARIMADLGWRIAADPAMPAYHSDDQFARPRATP